MKTIASLCVTLLALASSAQAQILRPEAINGALLGGVAGAVIGNNSGDLRHNAWKGAAIGAGAGLVLGEMVGNVRAGRDTQIHPPGGYVYRHAPSVGFGVSYGSYGHGHRDRWHSGYYGHAYPHYSYGRYRGWGEYSYAPAYGYYPGYGVAYPHATYGYYGYGSGATNGLLLGALAGGIIGHNSGEFRHNGWRGAAWGAGAGWLLGTLADAYRRPVVYESAPVMVAPPATAAVQPAAGSSPQQVTIINNYYNTPSPMSSANGLFGR